MNDQEHCLSPYYQGHFGCNPKSSTSSLDNRIHGISRWCRPQWLIPSTTLWLMPSTTADRPHRPTMNPSNKKARYGLKPTLKTLRNNRHRFKVSSTRAGTQRPAIIIARTSHDYLESTKSHRARYTPIHCFTPTCNQTLTTPSKLSHFTLRRSGLNNQP